MGKMGVLTLAFFVILVADDAAGTRESKKYANEEGQEDCRSELRCLCKSERAF